MTSSAMLVAWSPIRSRFLAARISSNAGKTTLESDLIHGGMPDVLPLHDVDDILGDVGGVVTDTFQVFGGKNQLERRENNAGIRSDPRWDAGRPAPARCR